MGLFAPSFLTGLATVALPLYLHLLKRQTTTPKQVSSLMLFESRTQSSTRHRRLRYFLLLSLRLLWLILLILAFANPFINRDAAAFASNRLALLVIDNSFSMRAGTRLTDAKDQAMSVLAGKGAARAQVAGRVRLSYRRIWSRCSRSARIHQKHPRTWRLGPFATRRPVAPDSTLLRISCRETTTWKHRLQDLRPIKLNG